MGDKKKMRKKREKICKKDDFKLEKTAVAV